MLCHILIFFSHKPTKRYSFTRSLTRIEWSTLRSYTHRIRTLDVIDTLNWESVSAFVTPPATEPLFSNLRYLYVDQSSASEIKIKYWLYMPLPSLISLRVDFMGENQDILQGPLASFSKFSPNLKGLTFYLRQHDITFSNFFSTYICQWQDLHTVDCSRIALDPEALAHLSRMPALTRLSFTPSAGLPLPDSPLFFSNLHCLTLFSESLNSISRLLSRTRLPAITVFIVFLRGHRSKYRFPSFLASIQTSAIGHTIQDLQFKEGSLGSDEEDTEDATPVLGFEDLQPLMAFSKLRRMEFSVLWEVVLSDSDLLTLASAWPHLEQLVINARWGWNTLGGITPNGLLQLLQTCQSLTEVAIAIDTRGYTEFRESSTILGLTLPPTFSINVIDSLIDEESVPAITAFFVGLGVSCPNFSFCAYDSFQLLRLADHTADGTHWCDICEQVNHALKQHA